MTTPPQEIDMREKIIEAMARLMGLIGRKPQKPVDIALNWRVQFQRFNPKPGDKDLIHYAKSSFGTFEIYDDGASYLLSSPFGPAELFNNLADAKLAALSTLKEEPALPLDKSLFERMNAAQAFLKEG